MNNNLIARNLNTLWNPCSQMKDYETFPPLPIIKAKGPYLIHQNGSKILDAISSWWCKSLGHAHPRLQAALIRQAKKFEHVILANTTNEVIVELSERLTNLTTSLKKVFFASEGSSAVEIALKMATHARQIRGQLERTGIAALANGYHGETLFALAVSDIGLYRNAYEHYLPNVHFIQNIPYISSRNDQGWANSLNSWEKIELQLEKYKKNLSVVILEPIVQAAGGMRIYSQDLLVKLKKWCRENDVYLIADEIMTGFGRTGKMFACHYANIEPDLLCLGKGLTSGYLPMSAVLTTDEIYQLFYNDYESGQSFLHSHTHSGNALAAAVALESLRIIEEEGIIDQALALEEELAAGMLEVADKTRKITKVRYIGGIVAADIIADSERPRLGYEVYRKAVSLGLLLRPLGNTIYWLPPLNIKSREIKKLRDLTTKAIIATLL